MAQKKFYVVLSGRETGIFPSWDECKARVDGYPGARYKSFTSLELAQNAFDGGLDYFGRVKKDVWPKEVVRDSISVDAACDGSPGNMEYQGVHTGTGREVFHVGPVANGTNNVAEFLGIVYALSVLKKENKTIPVYSDSQNAISWVEGKKAKTKLERHAGTEEVWKLIDRAEAWLKSNEYKTRILKWRTEKWGEIPADFGRK
ncbi:MAG: ribonuclease H family protein [Planctomycetes bacterium]|nr:ribonuclease H family protein [Planctomycetota bacterium]